MTCLVFPDLTVRPGKAKAAGMEECDPAWAPQSASIISGYPLMLGAALLELCPHCRKSPL